MDCRHQCVHCNPSARYEKPCDVAKKKVRLLTVKPLFLHLSLSGTSPLFNCFVPISVFIVCARCRRCPVTPMQFEVLRFEVLCRVNAMHTDAADCSAPLQTSKVESVERTPAFAVVSDHVFPQQQRHSGNSRAEAASLHRSSQFYKCRCFTSTRGGGAAAARARATTNDLFQLLLGAQLRRE